MKSSSSDSAALRKDQKGLVVGKFNDDSAAKAEKERERQMTYEELIEEAGAAIGIEGFAPDDDGVCMLVSDIGEIVIMDCKGPKEMVLLNAAVTDVPPNAGAALLAALESNKGLKDTNGATLSVDPETHRFELSRYAFLEYLDPDKFIEMVEKFATTLVAVREKLESAGDKLLEGELPDFGEYIRV